MKYTFEHNGKQKTVNIDDEWLKSQKLTLGISIKEAVELWLFDNGYAGNAEADALTEKAKTAGAGVRGEGTKRKAPTRKPDETKRLLVQGLFDYIQFCDDVQDPRITNIERMIAFTLGNDSYEITLTKKRKPKE